MGFFIRLRNVTIVGKFTTYIIILLRIYLILIANKELIKKMFRSYDHHQAENILIAKITQLTTDPLFYSY
jgi:hypothetical protein